jgi:acetyl-CoA C-acetyltransferase
MGITAENIATKWSIDRSTQDEIALQSHLRAAQARREGLFKEQILPINVKCGRDTVVFDQDEHIREDVTLEDLGKLRPAFKKDGSVTPGRKQVSNP